MRMRKITDSVIICVFLAVIALVPILTLAEEKVGFSPYENRRLAGVPEYTEAAFWSGDYFRAWETALSDHVYKRDMWLRNYVWAQLRLLRRSVVNGVLLTEETLLSYIPLEERRYDYNWLAGNRADGYAQLNEAVKSYGGVFLYVGVPEQFSMLRDYYPEGSFKSEYTLQAREECFFAALESRGIPYLDMHAEFTAVGNLLHYYTKSDHHYNLYGALYTTREIERELQALGCEVDFTLPEESDIYALPNPFLGSRGRKLFDMSPHQDQFLFYDCTVPFTREVNGQMLDPVLALLMGGDEAPLGYGNYMGGDFAETVIRTDRENLPNSLIFGDSFTNTVEMFYFTGFNETRALDLRYYETMGILEYVETHRPEVVICVINDTFYLSETGNGLIY